MPWRRTTFQIYPENTDRLNRQKRTIWRLDHKFREQSEHSQHTIMNRTIENACIWQMTFEYGMPREGKWHAELYRSSRNTAITYDVYPARAVVPHILVIGFTGTCSLPFCTWSWMEYRKWESNMIRIMEQGPDMKVKNAARCPIFGSCWSEVNERSWENVCN